MKVDQGSERIFARKLGIPADGLPAGYRATGGSYFLALPESYDPKKPHPLVLAICPFPKGSWMFLTWRDAMGKHPLLFVCPNDAGNEVPVAERGQRVLDALDDVRRKYRVDVERIFISGFSGGGRMSTAMVLALPGFFAGHIPMGGVFYGVDSSEMRGEMGRLRTKLGHLIFVGEKDAARQESELAAQLLREAKVPVELMVGEGKGHSPSSPRQGLSNYEWFLRRGGGRG